MRHFRPGAATRERQHYARGRRAVLLAVAMLVALTLSIAWLVAGMRPAAATEHDDEVRYTVTAEGITLPAGQVFEAHGHVNWHTTWAQHHVHFDPNNNQPGGAYIGKSFLPFNLEPGECVKWTQVHGFRYHFDAKKEEREICKPKTPPTPEPTPEPTEPPTEEPTTPPVTEEPTEEPTEPPATEEPTEPPTSEPTPVPSEPTEPPTTTEPEPEPSWTPPSPSPTPSPSVPSSSSPVTPAAPGVASPSSNGSVSSMPTTSASSSASSADSTSSRASSATAPELARTGINPIAWVAVVGVLCLAGVGALAIGRRRSDS